MMNYIWTFMLLLGIVFAAISGTLGEFSDGLMKSCEEGISFMLGLAGIMAVWSGFMNIAQKTGLIEKISQMAAPFMRLLLTGKIKKETEATILMSFAANLFGAGNSSTVFALRSMELLDRENRHGERASNEMCMFLAVNMSMVQLIPITVIKIRTDAGAAEPGNIILPSLLAGIFSMVVSVTVCKWQERRRGGR